MMTEYIVRRMATAQYKLLADGTYFGEIVGLRGVWASAKKLDKCRLQLQEVLEDWLVLKIRSHEKIPGFTVRVKQRQPA